MSAEVVTDALAELCRRLASVDEGRIADYIPQLALARADSFGLALVSMDGHLYQAGDADSPFTLQSVSKPFVYALALSELGLDEVTRWVGTEPSGEAFNAISLEPGTGRPANPMINAGAIVTTGLVPPAGRFERVLDLLSACAGRPLEVDEEVYASESATGDRNRALAYLMRSSGSLPGGDIGVVETYFRQCAVRATAADLALMSATLANGGRNPVTGAVVMAEPVAVQVLAVMATCGMYDAAGEWLLRVGLPAKGGVSGGLIAASPARFGVAAYSPPLDAAGNSVRGVAAMRELSQRFGLHLMRNPGQAAPTVTATATARRVPSGRARAPMERAVLEREGDRVAVVAAQGGLDFTATERVLYELGRLAPATPGWVVVDLERVTQIDDVAMVMLDTALERLAESGHRVGVVGGLPGRTPWRWPCFASRGEALAWGEDGLLAEVRAAR